MAKVTFTIEDIPGGKVKVVMTPSAETLLQKIASHGPEALTAAEGYSFTAVNAIRTASKRQSNIIIPVPRIGR
jgi:hypothetical protein